MRTITAGSYDPMLPYEGARNAADGFSTRPVVELDATAWTKARYNFGGHARWAREYETPPQPPPPRDAYNLTHGWRM